MCGRFTNRLTWREIVAFYRLTVPATPERNLPARYNICPTDTIDTVIERDGKRDLGPMRWGLCRHGGPSAIVPEVPKCPWTGHSLSFRTYVALQWHYDEIELSRFCVSIGYGPIRAKHARERTQHFRSHLDVHGG